MTNAVKQNTKVITGKIRMNYVNLFTPKAMVEGEAPRYSLSILIPKSDKETLSRINAAIEAAKKGGASIWQGKVPENLKTPLRDGDVERPEYPEYGGHYFLNASSKHKPGVVDRYVQEILFENEVYSGCYGRVSLNFYAFNKDGNKGIGCGLFNVQKLADGEALAVRSRAEDDFEAVDSLEDILS